RSRRCWDRHAEDSADARARGHQHDGSGLYRVPAWRSTRRNESCRRSHWPSEQRSARVQVTTVTYDLRWRGFLRLGKSLSFNLVRSRGLEPPRVAPLPPQGSASTNSATTAVQRTCNVPLAN